MEKKKTNVFPTIPCTSDMPQTQPTTGRRFGMRYCLAEIPGSVFHEISQINKAYLENKLLLFSINFTPKTSHSCLKIWYTMFSRYIIYLNYKCLIFFSSTKKMYTPKTNPLTNWAFCHRFSLAFFILRIRVSGTKNAFPLAKMKRKNIGSIGKSFKFTIDLHQA